MIIDLRRSSECEIKINCKKDSNNRTPNETANNKNQHVIFYLLTVLFCRHSYSKCTKHVFVVVLSRIIATLLAWIGTFFLLLTRKSEILIYRRKKQALAQLKKKRKLISDHASINHNSHRNRKTMKKNHTFTCAACAPQTESTKWMFFFRCLAQSKRDIFISYEPFY